MNKTLIALILIAATTSLCAQRHKSTPVLQEVNNKEVVLSIYPNADKVDKLNDYWFSISDRNNKLLGYAMSSTAFCKDVIGYCNTTPVLIITNTKFVIRKTALLSNWESPGYVNRLVTNGFFNHWNGLSLKEASKVQIDGYAGATMTATAVNKNVQFLLDNGSKNLPKKKKK